MINKNNIYAVVGASKNHKKYGYQVFKSLKESGYVVIPINLHEKEILGSKVFKSIMDVNLKINTIIFVTAPIVTEKILKEVKQMKINKVWMQPGSESKKAIDFCQRNKIECIHNACIMINKKNI